MKPRHLTLALLTLSLSSCRSGTPVVGARAERQFRFEYNVTLTAFPAEAKKARIWLPVPQSDEAQSINNVHIDAAIPHRFETESVYGNRSAYLELSAPFPSELSITLSMDVARREVSSMSRLAGSAPRDRLLSGDLLAPLTAEARSRAEDATGGRSEIEFAARGIYDRVLSDVDYDKTGQGWGRGDLEYVCDEGKGNCSDFHTLFIAMARTEEIPSVFEIGFPLPAGKTTGTIGGYHCWAWYQGGDGWHPIDASEADKAPEKTDYFFGTIDANRVAFSRGRDLVLEPPQEAGPVNFFVYPHIEVDGKAGACQVEKTFRFRDV